jgi:hypothetical protein
MDRGAEVRVDAADVALDATGALGGDLGGALMDESGERGVELN